MKRTGKEVMDAIKQDGDAYTQLSEADPGAEREFRRIDAALRRFRARVQRHFPEANYYTGSGGFNLLLGPSHDDKTLKSQQALVALSGLASIGDGDW